MIVSMAKAGRVIAYVATEDAEDAEEVKAAVRRDQAERKVARGSRRGYTDG
jgi:hypothetical protein